MSTLIYNPKEDNPSYRDCIYENIVLNEQGEVKIVNITSLPKSIQDVNYVLSGKGLYRAWLSNLQKSIRRGKVKDAIYSANQCIQFKGLFFSHIINRVCKVIISEDIGCANNVIVFDVWNFLKQFEEEKKIENKKIDTFIENRNKLFLIISKMCESYKSRITDHALLLTKKMLSQNQIVNNCTTFDASFKQFKTNIIKINKFDYSSSPNLNFICDCINDIFNLVKFGSEKCTLENEKIKLNLLPYCKPSKFSKKIYLLWDRVLCNSEYIRMFLSSTTESIGEKEESISNSNDEENQLELNKKVMRLNLVNQGLYNIWYMNSGDESVLNIIHAFFNIIFASKIVDDLENKSEDDITKNSNFDEICNDDTIQIMSASYDKHVRKWKTPARNSINFFLRYGVKLNKLHPNLESLDEELYYQLNQKLN